MKCRLLTISVACDAIVFLVLSVVSSMVLSRLSKAFWRFILAVFFLYGSDYLAQLRQSGVNGFYLSEVILVFRQQSMNF